MRRPPTRRAAALGVVALAGGSARAQAPAPHWRRKMFTPDTLAQADAAELFVVPRGLLTRTRITPQSLREIAKPVTVTKGSDRWTALVEALADADLGPAEGREPEVRVGAVLKAGGRELGSISLQPSSAAENGRVQGVADGAGVSAPVAVAQAIEAAAAR